LANAQLTAIIVVLLLLVGLAQLLGYLFMKLRQPKVVGEILAGVVLGPALLGRLPFMAHLFDTARHPGHILTFVYWLGRLLLMFFSGDGIALTSVPVVTKIFADLKILHTRFARLILGVAVLEDIVLWLALAVATAIASKTTPNPWQMSWHLFLTVAYFVLGLTLVPRIIKRINTASWNTFAQQSPTGYAITVLLAYCAVAGALDVNLVFAAFLAGFAVTHKKRRIFEDALDAIGKVSFAFFIPVYFAIVGLKLALIRGVSLPMIAIFIISTCAIKVMSVSLAGRFAGFRGLDLINLGITTNARGGPGIVLASVAFDAGIISSKFSTTLVIAAVLTSQLAGAWLDYVLRKGWPLLKPDAAKEAVDASSEGLSTAKSARLQNNPDVGHVVVVDPGDQPTRAQ